MKHFSDQVLVGNLLQSFIATCIILYSGKLWRGFLIWRFGKIGKDGQIKNSPISIIVLRAYGAKSSDRQI